MNPNYCKDFLEDVSGLAANLKGDVSAQDFIDAADAAIAIINDLKALAQKKVDEQFTVTINFCKEYLIDSFGGENCTMRNLKGE